MSEASIVNLAVLVVALFTVQALAVGYIVHLFVIGTGWWRAKPQDEREPSRIHSVR